MTSEESGALSRKTADAQLEEQAAIWDAEVDSYAFPLVTVLLIALNLAVFLYQSTLSLPEHELFILRWAVIPLELTEQDLAPTTPVSVVITTFTAIFLHDDWSHLSINSFYLWIFGQGIENEVGRVRFLLLYLLFAACAALTHVFINPLSLIPLIGASGAISGLMAAHLVLLPKSKLQFLVFVFWMLTQLAIVYSSPTIWQARADGVAVWAHLGGLSAGILLGCCVRCRSLLHPRVTVRWISP